MRLKIYTKKLILKQMSQYGQPIPEDKKMNEIVSNILLKKMRERKFTINYMI